MEEATESNTKPERKGEGATSAASPHKDNNYFADFFKWKKNKKYMVEIIPKFEGNNYIMDLFRGKKIEKFNVKITGT